jgi:hypothetical protein
MRTLIAMLALLALGCGGSATDPGRESRLTVLSGSSVSDTIEARLAQPLVVEVLEEGQPRAGIVVRFAALPSSQPARALEKTVLVADANDDAYATELTLSTDADGRARARVALGTVAGGVRVAITVPSLGLSDTARYSVLPGAPASILVTVRDTAVLVNARYSIGAAVVDRRGNGRPETPTYSSLNALASVDAGGNVQASSIAGRGAIAIRAGAITDTATFVVVPPDLVATSRGGSLVTIRLDGSNREVWQLGANAYESSVLSPRSDLMAFSAPVNGLSSSVFVVGRTGAPRRIAPAAMPYANGQRFSRDGQWVYFSTSEEIWRVRIDGSQPEKLLGRPAGVNVNYRDPTPSPDGNLIAYFDQELFVHDVATGQSRRLGVLAVRPVFSPDGTRIAYNEVGRIGTANVDGTGARLFGCPATSCNGVGWTKDGQWLLTQAGTQFAMANVNTREWITIPGTWGSYGIYVQE